MIKLVINWILILYMVSIVLGGISGGIGLKGLGWFLGDVAVLIFLIWTASRAGKRKNLFYYLF